MRFRSRWYATLLFAIGLIPSPSSGLPDLRALDGFLDLTLADSMDCDGPGACVAVDVAMNAASNPLQVLLFDLQVMWDPSYWELDAILPGAVTPGFVARDDAQGFIDDLFGDVGLGAPIAVGSVWFQLVFEVTGSGNPPREVFAIGDLSSVNGFFMNPVLVADAGFDTFSPTPNAQILTPEPTPGTMLLGGLVALSLARRREGSR